MKKENHLLVQIGVRVAAFFLLMILLIIFVIYIGGTSMFLEGKDEMLDRDLKRIKSEILLIPEMQEVFDLWAEHPGYIALGLSLERDDKILRSILDRDGGTYNAFSEYTDDEKMYAASIMCTTVSSWLNYEQSSFDYDSIYIMDISDEHLGFVYCVGDASYSQNNDSISTFKDIDVQNHPAIKKILSGNYGETEYEVSENAEGKSVYIGYAPIDFNGKVNQVICIEYDWSVFKKGLFENLMLMAAIGLAIMISAGSLLIGYLRKTVVIPTTKIQKSVRDYITSKDSAAITQKLETVTAGNELGILASDVTHLAVTLDEHISKLKESGEEMKVLTVQVMEALAHTIDAKDKYTNGHSERVAIYSRMIAMNLGLSEEDQNKIYYMGLLHDIGKIGIPGEIIKKSTKLTDEEFALVQSHPIMGYEILKEIKSMPDLALGARWHHELYDGTGYPDKKSGDEIPFLVRIIAVADSYDAMTSNRSYREYLPQEEVRKEIEKNIGKQFDPDVARCMLKIIDADKNYSLHE